ncbi:MAG TPA: hypothetical protein VH041_00545 [Caldimonas sp.]|jgi:hypothetical protein|nr:hypothetical protein [Caldimonas sp.]HEX4232768.1 hypothetical protein [Caldimonas sp.]
MVKSHTLAVAVAFAATVALAQESSEGERYTLKKDVDFSSFPRFGAAAIGDIPFDKSYGELTAAQQNRLKLFYVALGDRDEPPFPLQGLAAIYRPVAQAQQKLSVSGEFRADAEIDQEGNVVAVAVRQSPDAHVTNFMANILLLTKFKPALCQGQPCAMGFPVKVTFKVD